MRTRREGEQAPALSQRAIDILRAYEDAPIPALRPDIRRVAEIPLQELTAFSQALAVEREMEVRRMSGELAQERGSVLSKLNAAVVATRYLVHASTAQPIGLLSLERLEMTPAGIERGELVATIPLAPGEETAVTHKEWSVTSKEFTTIVTDSLEETSEVGVTDNTDLSQSTTSQNQHSTQFNITGTVQGGIPIINGSSTTGLNIADTESNSANSSIKHATSITRKASARARQEHKTTISTKTVTGTSETSTRVLKNTDKDPIRVDYFSLMRKWRVRLYRYGLRLTYDVVIPEPGAAMRRAYMDMEALRNQLGPFDFQVGRSQINTDPVGLDGKPPATGQPTIPRFQWFADYFGAAVRPFPPAPAPVFGVAQGAGAEGWSYLTVDFEVPQGAELEELRVSFQIGGNGGNPNVQIVGARYEPTWDNTKPALVLADHLVLAVDGSAFMKGAVGRQKIVVFMHRTDQPAVVVKVISKLSAATIEQWRSEVWSALYNAAQVEHLARQQDVAERLSAMEEKQSGVDTLTLRREESDELMKCVIKFILGTSFDFMPDEVKDAFAAEAVNVNFGIAFDDPRVDMTVTQWGFLRQHMELVRFINQAIEWENVVTFLYSYFWDLPESWGFIRRLRHPDATRQAFLRAGSARVVLTVRKGWEQRWMHFVDTGEVDEVGPGSPQTGPYLSIAQEIAAYDDRNYPGIPPANPARTVIRLQDAVYTTSGTHLQPSADAVSIEVEDSSGFVVGLKVVIDVEDERHIQEAPTILEIPDEEHIVVDKIVHEHNGEDMPFAVVQPGDKGALIAEWNEYTPSSGTDIAMTSNLATIA